MGVSENSVPLNPMVLLIIIPIKMAISLGIYPIFRQIHLVSWWSMGVYLLVNYPRIVSGLCYNPSYVGGFSLLIPCKSLGS